MKMKQNYDKHIKLTCATCGSGDFFEKNEKTGVITCKKCNRVYHGGYDELVELNQKKHKRRSRKHEAGSETRLY